MYITEDCLKKKYKIYYKNYKPEPQYKGENYSYFAS